MARAWYALRDREPSADLVLNLGLDTQQTTRPILRAGFARVTINPDLSNPTRPVWLAGFDQHRAATAIHDDLWAIACVIDDGHHRLGIVALDAIGLFHDDVVKIRRRLDPAWNLGYTTVCATHNHSTPDLMGLWGPNLWHSGVDPRYREQVITASVQALQQAVERLEPAEVVFREIITPPDGLVTDTRKPHVYDSNLRLMHFTRPDSGATLGTLTTWGNHPETVWSRNTEITSDYCGYLRDALEKGIVLEGKTVDPGMGGIHLFINGAVGGLMSTTPSVTVEDPYTKQQFKEPNHDKARAVGRQLAHRILPELRQNKKAPASAVSLSIQARTVELPLDNWGFLLASILGLMDRGHSSWMKLRTEVALIGLGDASIACIPGEIYPELVNGGVERAPGADFDLEPVEIPPLRELMPGSVRFVFGLANDEIGYIIPKSEWDRKPPYLYNAQRGVYGEVNSVGPETARLIHETFRAMCLENSRRHQALSLSRSRQP